ncbi:AAA family ATPase [Actinomadura rayongensis]|uniref:AAA family ATPase n=1 Tax=Actinomadura rayongensis TaxID=1429076 RepID=UPI00192729F5|nr:ATP-binding protein [Actinomadura rayongensis]
MFDDDLDLPDPFAQQRYARLVGLDHIKTRLAKEAELILQPDLLEEWSLRTHQTVLPAVARLAHRPPLIIFAGDVGTGKTTLAETFADAIARRHRIDVRVKRLSLRARGTGAVGEMTRLIGTAFDVILHDARAAGSKRPTILVIDQADALAQSREASQMHHEDRAGVNALIRGISQVATEASGVLVIMCTNRIGALDPAIRRRAAAEFDFSRPDENQRTAILTDLFEGVPLSPSDVKHLVDLTGPGDRGYGHTYSDLVDRVLAATCLAAYPTRPITAELIAEQILICPPTPPFTAQP